MRIDSVPIVPPDDAIAIGLGVDFAIHTIERLQSMYRTYQGDIELAFTEFYVSTGRALMFNWLAIACGFGVLMVSKIVSLNDFGAMVALAVSASFFASVTVLPAMIKVFRPRFICAIEPD